MDTKEELGARIRRLRESKRLPSGKKMSMDDLARATELSRQAIYDVESGKRKYLQGETLHRFARALDVTEEEIILGYAPIAKDELPDIETVLRISTRLTEEDIAVVLRILHGLELVAESSAA